MHEPSDADSTAPATSRPHLADEILKVSEIQPREAPADIARKQAYSRGRRVPGANSPPFDLLNQADRIGALPRTDSMTPAYFLDEYYRILDWNDALSLAFDRTMEGRQGTTILDWVYHLENWKQVFDHGEKNFSDPKKLPVLDIEPVEYQSLRYGKIKATKRAFHMPDDQGRYSSWLVTLEPAFEDLSAGSRFHLDLVAIRKQSLLWSGYAVSYDIVLNNTDMYDELLGLMVGKGTSGKTIPADARILDLGAGTGNIARRLAKPGSKRVIFALDNNQTMINILRQKCAQRLSASPQMPGIVSLKQDVCELRGLRDEYFNYVILNNVLYALADPAKCLKDVYRVLAPGGEVRISGPRRSTRIEVVFDRIKRDLVKRGCFTQLEPHYEHVRRINEKELDTVLYQWETSDLKQMLHEAGFNQITFESTEPYDGQAMIVFAQK